MNMFERKKIFLLKRKIDICRLKAHNNGRFSLFDAKFAIDFFSKNLNYGKLKSYYDFILDWDEMCNLPYEVGIMLDKLTANNTVMIHRTNLNLDVNSEGLTINDALYNIMYDGLKNYGHLNAGGGVSFNSKPPSLTLTMTPLVGLTGYINLVSSYKSNDVIVVVTFPKDKVNSDGEIVDDSKIADVYDLSETYPRVKREFMVGVILKKNNKLDEFYTRDEIINAKDNTKSVNINR